MRERLNKLTDDMIQISQEMVNLQKAIRDQADAEPPEETNF